MDQTNAQVTDTQPTQETQDQNPHPGLQARIDELVARAKAAEAQALEYQQKMMELATQVVTGPARQAAPAQIDPLAQHKNDLDPRLVEVLEAQRRQFEQQLQIKTAALEVAQGKFSIMQSAATVPGIQPDVVQQAQRLYEQSKLAGNNPSPDEALRFAIGDAFLKQQARAAGVSGIPTNFYNPTHAVVPSAPAMPPQSSPALPADFESRPLQEQIALMEKLGYADKPL